MISHIRDLRTLAILCLLAPVPAMAQGALNIQVVNGYNLIVDSNVQSPPTYAPRAAYIGAQFCNIGNAPLTNVTANIGNYDTGRSLTVTLTSGSPVVGSGALFAASDVGNQISGPGIPAGATITGFTSASSVTISANATTSGAITARLDRKVVVATTSGSKTVTSAALFLASDAGLRISGAGIPAGATITSFVNSSQVTISVAATATGAATTARLYNAAGIFPVKTFGADALRPHLANTGDYSLNLEIGSGTLEDASRYIGTLAVNECRIQYWLFGYPACVNQGTPRTSDQPPCTATITGGVGPEDDLSLDYDLWATADSVANNAVTRSFTMRNEISASANKIWPNTDSKVPNEYLSAIEDVIGWGTIGPDGQPLSDTTAVYPGQRVITTQGIWYDLGNVGHGFDNNGDLIPDQNAWMQPVGDPTTFDSACFRMINVYGIVIVKLKTGGELLIPMQNLLYHENLPDNTGVVGLIYYQYIATKEGCSSSMTPYQEAASGFDNEKFAGDYGLNLGLVSGPFDSDLSFTKTDGASSVAPGGTLTYTVSLVNKTGVPLGAPELGTPLVFRETIPTGTTFVAGSADDSPNTNLTEPTGSGSYVQGYTDINGDLKYCRVDYQFSTPAAYLMFYSTDSGITWSLTEPSSGVTDIRWMLQATLSLDGGPASRVCTATNGVFDNGTLQVSIPSDSVFGATTNASTTVTALVGTFYPGDVGTGISGAGIPSGATIVTVNSTTSVVISAPATATNATGTVLAIARTGSSTQVSFQVTVNSSGVTSPIICNTARVGFGPAQSNVTANDCTLVTGPNSVSGVIFEDDGGTGGTHGNGTIDNSTEVGIGTGSIVSLYYDANADGKISATDLLFATTTTSATRALASITTNGTTTVTSSGLFLATDVGSRIYGTGIPAGAYITGFTSTNSVTISAAATAATAAGSVGGGAYSFTSLPDGSYLVVAKKYDGVSFAAATTASSTTVTTSTAQFVVGDIGRTISGTGIPAGATITGFTSSTSVTISAAATASGNTTAVLDRTDGVTNAVTDFLASRATNASTTQGWGNTTYDPNLALTTDSGILKLNEDLNTATLAISIDLDRSNALDQAATTTELRQVNFGFAPPFLLTKSVASATVNEGDLFNYTLVLENRLPSVGVQGPTGCQYTAWATTGGTGNNPKDFSNPTFAFDGPNRKVATALVKGGGLREITGTGFRLAPQAGTITRVEALYLGYFNVALTDDLLNLQATYPATTISTTIPTAAIDSYIGPSATLSPNQAISWDITSLRAWSFADNFATVSLLANPSKASSSDDKTFSLDAIGLRVTTNADCEAGASTTLNPVPLQDRFDSTNMSFVSAVPPPVSVSGSTIQWDNVGPILPGTTASVTVTMRAADVSGLQTGTCTGVGPAAITSITRVGALATVTTTAPHTLTTGQVVTIAGATGDPTLWNGTFNITVTGASTFTYTMTGTPGTSPAAGTKTFQAAATGIAAVSSLTNAGSVATVTTTAPHSLITGQSVTILGATSDATLWNGTFTITVTGTSTFTYSMSGTPAASPATGAVSFSAAPPSGSVCNLAETAFGSKNVYYADGRKASDDSSKVPVSIQGRGEIHGTVFRDLDNDGWAIETAPTDLRLASIPVSLWACVQSDGVTLETSTVNNKTCLTATGGNFWKTLQTTLTNVNGAYDFVGLATGAYIVQVNDTDGVITTPGVAPYGLTQTAEALDAQTVTGLDANGADCACDSTWGTSTANMSGFNQIDGAAEETINNVNFGYYSASVSLIYGNVWHDVNGNAARNAEDGGLGNFTVRLYTDPNGDGDPADGVLQATTTSDSSGNYSFTVTTAARYTIVVTPELLPNDVWTETVETTGGTGSLDNRIPIDLRLAVTSATRVGTLATITTTAAHGLTTGQTVVMTGATSDPTRWNGTFVITVTGANTFTYTMSGTPGTSPATGTMFVGFGAVSGSHDFGYTLGNSSTIGDRVFIDFDGDGLQDPTEAGIPNVTVWLYEDLDRDGTIDAGVDNLVQTDVTDGAGNYLFTGLGAGSYIVVVDKTDPDFPTGTTPTADPDLYAGTIGDRLYLDANGNGADNTEDGIPGVTVLLWADNGNGTFSSSTDTLIAATVTNINGNYLFTGLPAGNYFVQPDETTLPNSALVRVSADPTATLVTLASSTSSYLSADAGYSPSSNFAIGNRVWHDQDGDGVQDAGEVGIPNVRVVITNATVGDPCNPSCTVTTDESGYWYQAGLVDTRTYAVDVTNADLPRSFVLTTGTDPRNVTIAGADVMTVDFAYRYTTPASSPTGTIAGSVFLDGDGDAALDSGEEMTGITINLLDSEGYVVATTTSSGAGAYSFPGVFIGNYSVEALASYGTHYSTVFLSSTTGFPNLNVIYDASSATTADDQSAVSVDGVHSNLLQDFGYKRYLGSVGDTVYWDANENGTQDTGEPGFSGVTVKVRDCTWIDDGDGTFEGSVDANTCSLIGTTVTTADDPLTGSDESGKYLFSNLDNPATGHYYVIEVDTTTLPGTFGAKNGPSVTTYLTADPETDGQVCTDLTGSTEPQSSVCESRNLVQVFRNGLNYTGGDFGYQVLALANYGKLGDHVWIDANGDGIVDSGETGVSEITVWIDANSDGVLDGPKTIAVGTTNASSTVTSAALFTAADVGRTITGSGIPSGATITGFTNPSTVTISAAATATATSTKATLGPRTFTVVTTSGSATVTSAALFSANDVGRLISGTGIPAGAYISAVGSASSVTISSNATATGSVTASVAERTAVTDSDGYYLFTGLPNGNFDVRVFTADADWPANLPTTPTFEVRSTNTTGRDNRAVATIATGAVNNIDDGHVGNVDTCTNCDLDVDFGYRYVGTKTLQGTICVESETSGPSFGNCGDPQISSISRVGTLATVTTSVAHGLTTGTSVTITGASDSANWNGTFTITVIDATTFTYTMGVAPAAASPTGTMLAAVYSGVASGRESALAGVSVNLYRWTDAGTANSAWNASTGVLDSADTFALLGSTTTDANGDYSFTNVPDNVIVVFGVNATQNLRIDTTNSNTSVEGTGVLSRQLYDGYVDANNNGTKDATEVTVIARQALFLGTTSPVVDLDFAFNSTLGGENIKDFGDLPDLPGINSNSSSEYNATLLSSGASHRIRPAYTVAITSGSATATSVSFLTTDVGSPIVGTGIPAGTTITAVTAGVSATMSAQATATNGSLSANIGWFLGTGVTAEADGQASATAAADGLDDGVTLVQDSPGVMKLIPGAYTDCSVDGNGELLCKGGLATISASGEGWIAGWMDFNQDGDFADAGERIINQAFVRRQGASPVTSLTRSGAVATVTTPADHGLTTGRSVTIMGASSETTLWNGTFTITVTSSTTFTYTMSGTPSAASAPGTITYQTDLGLTQFIPFDVPDDPTLLTQWGANPVFFTRFRFYPSQPVLSTSTGAAFDARGVGAGASVAGAAGDVALPVQGEVEDYRFVTTISTTRATVSTFVARDMGGSVAVEWETTSERGTVGFFLNRWNEGARQFTRVNEKLIPAILTPHGGLYRYIDPAAQPGRNYRYELIEVEASGKRNAKGPYDVNTAATAQMDVAAQRPQSIEPDPRPTGFASAARVGRGLSADSREADMARQAAMAAPTTPAVGAKIGVTEAGIHYASLNELQARSGLVIDKTWLSSNRNLYALKNRDEIIPFAASADNSGILFYGQALDSMFSRDNIYWLGPSDRNSPRMKERKDLPLRPASGAETFVRTLHLEQDFMPAPGLFKDAEADYWFWDYAFAGDGPKVFSFRTDGAKRSGGASLTVRLKGGTETEANPDHHVVVKLNGRSLGDASWDGLADLERTFDFDSSLLVDGENSLEIENVADTQAAYSLIYLDSFDVRFESFYRATGDRAEVSSGSNTSILISGFTRSDIMVFDITNPREPVRVTPSIVRPTGGGYGAALSPARAGTIYYAVAGPALKAPTSITRDGSSDLRQSGNRAEYVIVTSRSMMDVAKTLAAYRSDLTSKVVDIEDVYDEFNGGIRDPHALRSFLSYARSQWSQAPKYVLLAGDGTWDYKDVLGLGNGAIPPMMVSTPTGIFPSDTWFGDVDLAGPAPEMAVGRLPAGTSDELARMIEKIQSRENASGDWMGRALMASDNADPAGEFPTDSLRIAASLPQGTQITTISLAEVSGDEARARLIAGINEGAGMINYIGHGGYWVLADEGMLWSGDEEYLVNAGRLPVMTAMTCLVGNFGLPWMPGLGEQLLRREGGGLAALWAPTGESENALAVPLAESFYRSSSIPGAPARIGDAIQASMKAYEVSRAPAYMLRIYTLLGDPAMRLRLSPPPQN